MKNIKTSFIFNLCLAGISLYVFVESLDKEIWRAVISGIGCFIFMALATLVFYRMKNNTSLLHK